MVNFYHMHSTECYAIIARWPSALVTLTNLISSKICYVGYTETKEVFKKLKLQFVSASVLVQSKMQSTADFHLMSHICWGKFSILDPHRLQNIKPDALPCQFSAESEIQEPETILSFIYLHIWHLALGGQKLSLADPIGWPRQPTPELLVQYVPS